MPDGQPSETANHSGAAPKIVTTASGLKYRVLQMGAGSAAPDLTDRVTVHYSGKLLDGTEFDNTRKRGRPASFAISRIIEGWAEGLQLMTEGSKYQFIVPPDLAYGDKGVSGIVGPQATLVIDVELLKVESNEESGQ
ncbi:MAG: FKBP-type peptidyl-prolyl cis-trans isomerase [Granulosicoccaceae bacterium]